MSLSPLNIFKIAEHCSEREQANDDCQQVFSTDIQKFFSLLYNHSCLPSIEYQATMAAIAVKHDGTIETLFLLLGVRMEKCKRTTTTAGMGLKNNSTVNFHDIQKICKNAFMMF